MTDSLPFLCLSDKKFELTANGIEYSEEIDRGQRFLSQSQQEMLDRFNDAIANITFNLNNDKQDTEIETSVPSTSCKYFTINELNPQKIDPNKHFYATSKYQLT